MKILNKLFLYFVLLQILNACNGAFDSVKRGLTGEKKNSTEEFLVEKKDPLVLPPNFNVLPKPGEDNVIKQTKTTDIEDIILADKDQGDIEFSDKTVEESLLKKIKKK